MSRLQKEVCVQISAIQSQNSTNNTSFKSIGEMGKYPKTFLRPANNIVAEEGYKGQSILSKILNLIIIH